MEIRFRQIEQEDLPQLRDWRNQDGLHEHFREYRLLNMHNQQEWFDYISTSRDVEMFGVVANNRLIGVCGLCYINWVNQTAEVSIYLSPESQRQGIGQQTLNLLASRAFDNFNLQRLWAEIYSFNERSIALFRRCGYVYEGTMRRHTYKQGQYHDSLLYGLLKDEYKEKCRENQEILEQPSETWT